MESVRGLYGFDRIYACVYIYIYAHMHTCIFVGCFTALGLEGLRLRVLAGKFCMVLQVLDSS